MIASREYVKDLLSKVIKAYGDSLGCKKKIIGLNKQVSKVGAYMSSPIDVNPFDYEYIVVKVYHSSWSGTAVYRNTPGTTSASLQVGEFGIYINTTNVGCNSYSSSWKDVYADLVGYSTPAYIKMNQEIASGKCWE